MGLVISRIVRGFEALGIIFMVWFLAGQMFTYPPKIDPELNEYVLDFVEDAAQHGVTINPNKLGSLGFTWDLEYPELGMTYVQSRFGHRLYLPFTVNVVVARGPYREEFFRELVYHELGHALLELDHSDDPADIMYPYLPGADEIEAHWPEMVNKLFKDGKEQLGQ